MSDSRLRPCVVLLLEVRCALGGAYWVQIASRADWPCTKCANAKKKETRQKALLGGPWKQVRPIP